jgi:glutaminase
MADEEPFDVVSEGLAEVHRQLLPLDGGEVAAYIPKLAQADPDDFGLALVSMDGHRYQAGSSDVRFSIQSVSKPFVYALALSELGLDEISRRVGIEPSGDAFNAISLEHGTGRPANPMINAGAIATTSLVPADTTVERFERILHTLSAFAGRQLDVDEEVYRSEAASGDRNRALAYLMHAAGSLRTDPADAAEVYFRQCSVRVDTVDLAVMAATLAAGGVNPVTGRRVVPEQVAIQVMSVMATCGMYDAAGDWLVRVGLPAKSGVSGGLAAASPARFGIACYSPPLDRTGSPVRAVAALRELSPRFGLHLMYRPAPGGATVTACFTVDRDSSGGQRTDEQRALLHREGHRIALVAAQGELDFLAAERLVHALGTVVPTVPGWVIVDFAEVTVVRRWAGGMVASVLRKIAALGHRIALVGLPDDPARPDDPLTVEALSADVARHSGRTSALAWAEDALLAELTGSPGG